MQPSAGDDLEPAEMSTQEAGSQACSCPLCRLMDPSWTESGDFSAQEMTHGSPLL